ncbi:MAG: hypothetical protein KAH14_05695 [Clostridiales bacterium]|nr:hypothetical protein [Clostridiales bacterium]
MSKNAKRRTLIFAMVLIICIGVILITNIFSDDMEPDSYKYYIENASQESDMANAVTAIYLRYRLFDTLFEALLLGAAVSVVFYFAAPWEKEFKGKEDIDNE